MKGLLIAVGHPKAGPPPKVNPPGFKHPEPEMPAPAASGSAQHGGITPEAAGFRDQHVEQWCDNCEYFKENTCQKGVKVDFSKSEPSMSFCQLWEAKDDASETPQQENAEETGEPGDAKPGVAIMIGAKPVKK